MAHMVRREKKTRGGRISDRPAPSYCHGFIAVPVRPDEQAYLLCIWNEFEKMEKADTPSNATWKATL